MNALASSLALIALIVGPAPTPGEDLEKIYPPTMGWSQQGLFPTCSPDDVWELKSFEYRFGKDLEIACKRAVVAFGVHEKNVIWAVVFPEKPAEIETIQHGDGEEATSIFLRFAPAELDSIFPSRTVSKRGSAWLRARAQRIARHKVGWKWSTPAGNPTIVQPGWCLIDADTAQETRRFYAVDRNAGSMEYVAEFEAKPLPPSPPIEKKAALETFDEVWEAFDAGYAGFGLLPEVDWNKLGKTYRKQAAQQRTVFDLAAVINDMLAQLEDLHVWVRAGDEGLPGYTRPRPLNANWKATQALAHATQKAGKNLQWGRTEDGIGYLGIHGLSDAGLPGHVDDALERLADTWGLVVDLRFNGGGDEVLARDVAGRFLDEPRVYSLNQYRAGSKHDSLGEPLERRFEPRGPWRYAAPVVVLWGRKTLSSAESMALMFAQCPQVTTMGARTGGSSANPRRLELECGITVNQPRWLDMDPEGNPIEHVGVAPEVVLEHEPTEFTDEADPVAEAAFARLRKIPAGKRKSAR